MKWKLRDPTRFPAHWSEVVIEASKSGEPELLFSGLSLAEAERKCDTFRLWRWCLRNWPARSHRCVEIELISRITTRYDDGEVWVEVKPKTLPMLESAQPWLTEVE